MKTKKVIMLADMQSFYASVEKAAHPEYQDKPLVVAGDAARRSGIVLAACPIAKSYGVSTAMRLGEAYGCCPQLIVIKPRMQHYIDVSLLITRIFQQFTDLVEPYSIDEQFLDITGSLHLFGSPIEIARQIQTRIKDSVDVNARIGISENKILAKTACDNFAKKRSDGIFVLPKEEIAEHLWPLPVHQLFMVASRMTSHFTRMGLHTIGDLAQTPLGKLKQMMRSRFGKQSDIQAELYWRIANGIDDSPVAPHTHREPPKQIGHMMTLPRDYGTKEEIEVVLLELSDLVAQRSRAKGFMGWVVSAGAQGADFDRPTGFDRQHRLTEPTNVTSDVYRMAQQLLQENWNGLPVRRVGVSLSDLVVEQAYQIPMFGNRLRDEALEKTLDRIKAKYGNASILRAVSLTDAGQALDRSKKIGGHFR